MAATLRCDTIQNASSSTANLTLDASGNATVGNTLVMGSSFKRNRIINGDMRVDQRNAGASVTPTASGYTLDRWRAGLSVSSKYSVQQSSVAPTGFSNSLLVTSLSAYTVGASESFVLQQLIEGFNFSDFDYGTANAKTLTLSFWVRSSLTGTFGGCLSNSASDRSYPFTYTISSANTWEQKYVTIAGDTSGTWVGATNGVGCRVYFGLGAGSTISGTAGSWAGAFYVSATGATSVVGTNGATFYITGVQLEVGSVATPYERQIYSEQLAQCQRYYYRMPANSTPFGFATCMITNSKTRVLINFPVSMRIAPTSIEQTGTASDYGLFFANSTAVCSAVPAYLSPNTTVNLAQVEFTTTSGVTAGQSGLAFSNTSSAYLGFSAEL